MAHHAAAEQQPTEGVLMSTIDSIKPGAFISLTKAAEMLSTSIPTLRRRIAAGELPAFRSGRRIIRIRVSDLEVILHRVPSVGQW
jgi:excisionase family DNA binding protein